MNSIVGVKFMLRDAHYLMVVVSVAEAERIMRDWRESTSALKGNFRYSGTCLQSGVSWVVGMNDIIAIHTISALTLEQQLQELKRQQNQQQTIPYNKSGIA